MNLLAQQRRTVSRVGPLSERRAMSRSILVLLLLVLAVAVGATAVGSSSVAVAHHEPDHHCVDTPDGEVCEEVDEPGCDPTDCEDPVPTPTAIPTPPPLPPPLGPGNDQCPTIDAPC